jgi:serine/threonine-protein kinase
MADILDRLKAALAERYRIERELGSGGMATVYLAHDVKHDRNVAVKVFRPELAAALGTERFFREIKITANLSHPHILPLLDSGEADGFLYYVMPLVEGDSLRDRMNRDKQLSVGDALKITTQVASALSYAHSRDIVHRDIKPENILFQAGEVVVADFGIGLAVDSAGGMRLTETGFSLGTPAYMSPEQVSGEQEIDGRSDIYSLACVLYEMLAGDPPFVASNPRAVLAKHMTDPAPPITTVRSDVSKAVAAAISKALGKAPVARFDSAKEFSEALFAEAMEAAPEIKSIVVLPFDNMSPDPSDSYLGDGRRCLRSTRTRPR